MNTVTEPSNWRICLKCITRNFCLLTTIIICGATVSIAAIACIINASADINFENVLLRTITVLLIIAATAVAVMIFLHYPDIMWLNDQELSKGIMLIICILFSYSPVSIIILFVNGWPSDWWSTILHSFNSMLIAAVSGVVIFMIIHLISYTITRYRLAIESGLDDAKNELMMTSHHSYQAI